MAIVVLDDFGNDTNTGGTLADNSSQLAFLEVPGDSDWFRVSLVAGRSYLFTLRGVDHLQGTLPDPILYLRDASGSQVAMDDSSDGGRDAEIIFKATLDGTYYLDAQANGGGSGGYGIAMASRVDPLPNSSTTDELALWTPTANLIEIGSDVDWYRIALTKDHPYAFDLLGDGSRGTLADPLLRLYDHLGNQVAVDGSNSGFGLDDRILYTPGVDGTYYLSAESGDGTIGTYWLYAGEQTGVGYMDALLLRFDQSWAPDIPSDPTLWTITYSFMQNAPSYASAADATGFMALDTAHQDAIRDALSKWAALTDIVFVEVPDTGNGGVLRFGSNHGGAHGDSIAGAGYYPDTIPGAGDVWLNNQDTSFSVETPGSYGYLVLLHEIGHALGLKHPGNYSTNDLAPFLPPADDTRQNTVMSYNVDPHTGFEPTTPMVYDVDAIQYLYNYNTTTNAGNTTYTFSNTTPELLTVWDPPNAEGGGIDKFDASNQTYRVIIDLNEGHFSSIGVRQEGGPAVDNIAIANGSVIEKATGGSGNDSLIGNNAKNTLLGGAGNDTMSGGSGADTLTGGGGNDLLYGGKSNDQLTGNAGNDRFVFDTALTSNVDMIVDFGNGTDKIWLDNDIFAKLGAVSAPTNLAAGKFDIVGDAHAQDTNDYIIYNQGTGALSYDKDGSGSTYPPVQFAVVSDGLGGHPVLTSAAFQVID